MLYLILLFTVLPTVEIWLLLQLHHHLGLLSTVALVLATGVIGASLARAQGINTLWRIQQELQTGKAPTDALIDGALILVAGAVLITPGVLTDAFGFSLLIPPLRALVKRALKWYFAGRIQFASMTPGGAPNNTPGKQQSDQVIDVQVTEVRTSDPQD